VVTKTEQQVSSGFDTVKLLVSLMILVAGIIGFYYFKEESQLFRVLGILAVVVVAFLIIATTLIGKKSLGFAKDARVEVRKVVWPTRQETTQTTIAVLVMVLIVAIMLWLIDMFLGWGVKSLLG
jgi:preprotein translocase subunit SecE